MNIQWTCMAGFGPTAWNPGNFPVEMPIISCQSSPDALQTTKNHQMQHGIAGRRIEERTSNAIPENLISEGGSQ